MSVRVFTTDWSASIEHWPAMFDEHGLTGRPGLRFLEVGCFEGRTTLWLLEHVLTAPDATVTVVDPFPMDGQRDRFNRNVMPYLEAGKVRIWPYRSGDILAALGNDAFDFVYIDGDHSARQVLEDAVLAWRLLKPGGLMVFDDYWWPEKSALESPGIAVDAFYTCYWGEIAKRERCGTDQYVIVKAAA